MVINRKINRTIRESKSQYLGSLILIILSCLLFTMFNLLSVNMSGLASSFSTDYKQEDASFVTDKSLGSTDALRILETKFDAIIEKTGVADCAISEDKTLRVFSQNLKVNIPAIIKGSTSGSSSAGNSAETSRSTEPLPKGSILIDPAYAAANKINIGDNLELYGKAFKVNGFMSLPNYIYPLRTESDIMNDPISFGIAVIGKEDFESLGRGNSFYSIRFNGDRNSEISASTGSLANIASSESLESRIAAFKTFLRSENTVILSWTNVSDNPRVTFVTMKLAGIDKVSAALPIAILLLTCVLTGIVLWRMLKRESVIIGTFYALGYKKREIIRHYLMYPLVISLLGGLTGTLLGALALKPMLTFMVSYFNIPVGTLKFDISYLIISILLPVIFLLTSSYLVVKRALKTAPIELMKGGAEKSKVGLIEKRVRLDRLSFPVKFKLREQLRSIPRSLFLLMGIILATMLLLMGFASKSSLDSLMRDSFDEAFKYNYHYVFNSLQQGKPAQGEAFSELPFALKSDPKISFTVYGVNPDSRYITFSDKAGTALKSDKVIITRPLADKLGLKPADEISMINRLDSKEYALTIDSIAETYVGQYIYVPIEQLNNMLQFPAGSYMGLWSTEKLDISENKLLASVTVEDMRKAFNNMTQPLQSVMGVMAFMSFMIGLLVIYVVTSLAIEENRQNISLMKVLGYRRKEVYSLILNSSTFIVVLGYILGVPLLLTSLSAMFASVTKDMNLSIPVSIDYIFVAVGFAVIYLTYEVSKLLSRRKINRISMAEALKYGVE